MLSDRDIWPEWFPSAAELLPRQEANYRPLPGALPSLGSSGGPRAWAGSGQAGELRKFNNISKCSILFNNISRIFNDICIYCDISNIIQVK